MHSGWNYFEFMDESSKPKYRIYKLSGTATGSCNINEIELWGVETINDSAAGTDCQPKLVVNGALQTLTGSV